MQRRIRRRTVGVAALLAAALVSGGAESATIDWQGHTWQVTTGGMAGVCDGSAANVTLDSNGYLHLRISQTGSTWTAAELFTTDKLGFGTYQWHLDGPIDGYDKNVVVGLFPYGPAAGIGSDGTNEIDIEYSRWGQSDGPNGDFTDYPAMGTTIGELSYRFSLAGSTLSTSRFTWSESGIVSSLLGGLAASGDDQTLLQHFDYEPPNPTLNIPQQALPLGMNFWCFDAPPSDGQPVELVIRDFTFVPAGTAIGGAAGGAGLGGAAGSGSSAGGRAGAGGTGTQAGAPGTGATAGQSASNGGTSAGSGGAASGAGEANSAATAGLSGASGGAGTASAAAGHGGAAGSAGAATAGARAIGDSGSASTSDGAHTREHGCGCSIPRRGDAAPPLSLVLALILGTWRRRRRVGGAQ
jgi:hypothetical protein